MDPILFLHEKQPGNCDRVLIASGTHLSHLHIDQEAIHDVAIEWRPGGGRQLYVWILKDNGCFIAKTRSRNLSGYEDQRQNPRGTGQTAHGALEALRDRMLGIPHDQPTLIFIEMLLAAIPEPELSSLDFVR
jgi:hypothetical protein